MAGNVLRDPGRLGIFFLLLLFLAAVLSVFLIDFACGGDESADGEETIVTEAATPEVTTLDGNDSGSSPASGDGTPAGGAGAGTGGAGATGPALEASFISLPTGGSTGGGSPGTPTPEPPAPEPGAIVGTVVGESGPAGGIAVSLIAADGTPTGIGTTTLADGTFRFELAPGQYKLFFSDPGGAYEPAWYGGYGPGNAALVNVTSSQDTAVSQTLTKTASPGGVSGAVHGPDGKGLAGISVFAFLYRDLQCQPLSGSVGAAARSCDTLELKGAAVTDSNGEYTVNGLEVGSYKILFSPLGTELTLQWYREQSTHRTAKTVAVEDGKITAGIDAELYAGGTISGVITREGGAPAPFALVDVYDESGVIVYSSLTDGAGNYQTNRLPDGAYRVHAATHMSGVWTDEWYSDKSDFASADPVTVTRGSNTGGINIEIDSRGGIKIEIDSRGGIKINTAGNVEEAEAVEHGEVAREQVQVPEETGTADGSGTEDSGGDGAVEEGADVPLLPHEYQQEVVTDGGDDEAGLGQVERDEATAA